MKEEDIPDYNIFMVCPQIDRSALSELHPDYSFRNCREEELDLWKAFPFDSASVPIEYEGFMNQIINDSYSKNIDTFFQNTIFACDKEDKPVATCSRWKAYGKINTIHWLKTLKAYEGRGIGRAILSAIMKQFGRHDYPIYLHTQPGSFRAIKLYSDFGFHLLRGGKLGTRINELEKCLPILREFLPKEDFDGLKVSDTSKELMDFLENETTIQF